jgi:hypothetical protein
MVLGQRAFVSRDPFVFPDGLPILVVIVNLLDGLHDFFVGKILLESLFTDEALERLQSCGVVGDLLLVIVESLNDASTTTELLLGRQLLCQLVLLADWVLWIFPSFFPAS